MSIDQKILDQFEAVVESQRKRIADMKAQDDFIDYSKLDKLVIGVCGGDGIGPMITGMAQHALETLLADKVKVGKVEFRVIDGLTIERRAELGCAIPPDVMEELKQCHAILKGPTTTPRKGDPWPNVESANVAMRKALDLFANVRPVKVPELGIDWTFYRENTEGGYAVGSQGMQIDDDLFLDFTVATSQGCERIARLAFDYATKDRQEPRLLRHQGEYHQDDGRQVPRYLPEGRKGVPGGRVRRLVHRHHDREAARRQAPPRLQGGRAAQPVRRYHHR